MGYIIIIKCIFLIWLIGKNGIRFNSHYLLSIFLCRFSNVSFNLLSFYSSSGKPKDLFLYFSNPKFVWDYSPKLGPIWPKSISSLKSCPWMNNYLFIFLDLKRILHYSYEVWVLIILMLWVFRVIWIFFFFFSLWLAFIDIFFLIQFSRLAVFWLSFFLLKTNSYSIPIFSDNSSYLTRSVGCDIPLCKVI